MAKKTKAKATPDHGVEPKEGRGEASDPVSSPPVAPPEVRNEPGCFDYGGPPPGTPGGWVPADEPARPAEAHGGQEPQSPAVDAQGQPAPTAVAKMGRPSIYSEELAALICAKLAEGQSLRSICAEDGMPAKLTVLRWVFEKDDFRAQYEHARRMQTEAMMDEIKDIADDSANDYMERLNRKGEFIGWAENGDSTKRAQLRITTRQWIAERMAPKKWGAKQQVTHQNPDGTPVGSRSIDPRLMTPEAREALADALRAAMREGSVEAEYQEEAS